MGYQQLLLILLGTVVVIVAIIIGLSLFSSSAVETNRDQLIADLNTLSSDAQSYYKKQAEYGGGSGSFAGWKIPDYFKKYEGGKIKAKVQSSKNRVRLTATGLEIGMNGRSKVKVILYVNPTTTSILIEN
jgi:hypothetical protein